MPSRVTCSSPPSPVFMSCTGNSPPSSGPGESKRALPSRSTSLLLHRCSTGRRTRAGIQIRMHKAIYAVSFILLNLLLSRTPLILNMGGICVWGKRSSCSTVHSYSTKTFSCSTYWNKKMGTYRVARLIHDCVNPGLVLNERFWQKCYEITTSPYYLKRKKRS